MDKKTPSKKKPAKKNTTRKQTTAKKSKTTSSRSRRSSKPKAEKVADTAEVKVKKVATKKAETRKKPTTKTASRSRKRTNASSTRSRTKDTSENQKNVVQNKTPKKVEVVNEKTNGIHNVKSSSHNKTNTSTTTTSKSSNNDFTVTINQNVAILIDGNNIEKSIHSLLNTNNAMLDFDNIIPKLLRNRGLNRLIYFREGLHISSKLADRLHKKYFGTVVPCHKSADIPLSITATQLAEKVDTIIILSGDSDYVDLVRHLRSRGVRVEIAAIKQTTAKILIDEADFFTEITKTDCYVR